MGLSSYWRSLLCIRELAVDKGLENVTSSVILSGHHQVQQNIRSPEVQ